MEVWLASQSLRRATMLQEFFPEIKCEGFPDVDETPSPGSVDMQVLSICQKKSQAVPANHEFDVVVVCDTMLADPDDMDAYKIKSCLEQICQLTPDKPPTKFL